MQMALQKAILGYFYVGFLMGFPGLLTLATRLSNSSHCQWLYNILLPRLVAGSCEGLVRGVSRQHPGH
jgi:hypothetical protein